jgi:hypothetical protein
MHSELPLTNLNACVCLLQCVDAQCAASLTNLNGLYACYNVDAQCAASLTNLNGLKSLVTM